MNAITRLRVRERAGNRCEYCHARQDDEPFYRYQIEHVIAKQHGGPDDEANLALACPHCNSYKGPNLAGLDSFDNTMIALFNPRTQNWDDHFEMVGPMIAGRTPIGRATVRVLNMNHPDRVDLRAIVQAQQPK